MATTPLIAGTDLDARYGASNVTIWSDLDDDASAVKIAARKLLACRLATSRAYDALRASPSGFTLPLSAAPDTLLDAIVKLAGYWISTPRGVTNYDKNGNPMTPLYADFVDAMRILDDIAKGNIKLEIDT